jgi:NAD+ kinase
MSKSRLALLVFHTRREAALRAALDTCRALSAQQLQAVVMPENLEELQDFANITGSADVLNGLRYLGTDCQVDDLEVVLVLGGDGTILKAAEVVRESQTPIVGINLGHVGFLAESEHDELHDVVRRVVEQDYVVTELLTVDVLVKVDGKPIHRDWALNEATVEKSARERMLEVVVEIDGRPLSSFGCDGIVMSTPTGSTAYAFSAGGPVVWPSVEAMLLVPISAHALFARPMVVNPNSILAVEVLKRSAGVGSLWCDGRRSIELPLGARVEVSRSARSVRLGRLNSGPFTDRLVSKFLLPTAGWRGPGKDVDSK